ncbi:MAG: mercuric reductase [Spirochaetaceae bacterium]|nr:MAG: mercuric reductase [Spirochaetaceae bacterium]
MTTHDIIVIGGGAGGLSVASGCAQLGMKVALIEREHMGGDCLHFGCVPSKALLHIADQCAAARSAARFSRALGRVSASAPDAAADVDMAAVNRRIAEVIDAIAHHDSVERFEGLGAEVFPGSAEFTSSNEVVVNDRRLSARRVVIATGSRAAIPPVPGLDEGNYLTNRDVFSLPQIPRSIAVMGAGPIGVELGQAFHRLGSNVTLIEMAPRILPRDDADLAAIVHARLVAEGVTVWTGARVERVERLPHSARLHLVTDAASPVGSSDASSGNTTLDVERVLVAAGRTANSDGLNLSAAGLEAGRGGVIPVDDRLRTAVPHIYAIGDVNGILPFTHVAGAEAGVIVRRVALHAGGRMNYRAVPWVSYTDPELASVGLSQDAAEREGVPHRVIHQPLSGVDRAHAEEATDGLAKFVLDRKDRVIGVQIAAPGAGELLGPALHAVTHRWKFTALRGAMVPYPTMLELYGRAVSAELAPKLFNPRVRRILRTLFRYRGTGPSGGGR